MNDTPVPLGRDQSGEPMGTGDTVSSDVVHIANSELQGRTPLRYFDPVMLIQLHGGLRPPPLRGV